MRIKTPLALLVTAAILPLSSCAILAPASIAATGMVVSDQRTFGASVDDRVIAVKIRNELSKLSRNGSSVGISISVMEGRVMMVGIVGDQQFVDSATKAAWTVKGVREIINELKVGQTSFGQESKDSWITQQIKSKYLLAKNVRSSSYSVATSGSVVYVIGIATNAGERSKVLEIAAATPGVTKVVSYVIIKDDVRRWRK